MENQSKNFGALWLKEGQNGKYMSGKCGDIDIIVFKNGFKNNPKAPDYIIRQREKKQEINGNQKNNGYQKRYDEGVPF